VTASAPEFAGILIACGSAATCLLARDARLRYAAAVVALIAAPALVLGDVWDTSRIVSLRHPPEKLAVLIMGAVIAAAVVAAIFRRFQWAFPIAAFAVLPLRVPVTVGGQTSHLLVPLYLVIAGAVLCFGYAAVRGPRPREDPARRRGQRARNAGISGNTASLRRPPLILWLYRVLAATLLLYAIQSAYSVDVSNAIENACFFLVPFALLFATLGEVRWSDHLLSWVLATVTAVSLVFAAVAFWEYAARDLLLSRGDLLASNQLHLYFRVNSLFYDPNILGRDLALVMTGLGAYLAWARSGRLAIAAAAAAGILLAALALSYSITGFVALVAGLLVVMALRWGLRWAIGAGLAIVVAAAVFFAASGVGRTDLSSTDKINRASAGRVSLVTGGYHLARDRPVWGWGSGSFGASFKEHIDPHARTTVSHSEPLTVGAEQGAIGLVVYIALVVLGLIALLSGARGSLAATGVAACFVALFVHSLGYADFSGDPAMWALLGVGVALRLRRRASAELRTSSTPGRAPAREPRPATA
jgi:putative inorganic carbon (hco3(-)) transporter